MTRKSAYALKARDPAFASAWALAVRANARARAKKSALSLPKEPALSLSKEPALSLSKGDKVEEVDGPPDRSASGDTSPRRSAPFVPSDVEGRWH